MLKNIVTFRLPGPLNTRARAFAKYERMTLTELFVVGLLRCLENVPSLEERAVARTTLREARLAQRLD